MKNRKIKTAFLSLIALGLVACGGTSNSTDKGGNNTGNITATDDTTSTDKDSNYIPEDEATGGLVYELSETQDYYIVTGFLSVDWDIVIPSVYQGLPVREIGEEAFKYATIDSIRLPSSIKTIRKNAFLGLSTEGLLTKLTLPEGLETLEEGAFMYCQNFTEVTLPSTLKTIGKKAFHLCLKLKKFKLNGESQYFTVQDGILYDKEMKIVYCYPKGLGYTTYDLPSSVEIIDDYAFYGASSLTGIAIPNDSNLTEIREAGLGAIFTLTTLRLERAKKLTTLGDGALRENQALTKVTIPSTVTSMGKDLLRSSYKITTIEFLNSPTYIPENFAYGVSLLTNITIPSTVTEIRDQAFAGCSNMTKLTIPSSVTTLGKKVFEGCTSLKTVNIPSSLTEIGEALFANCRSITALVFPEGLTKIGERAFSGCSSLASIDLSNTKVETIEKSAFMDCKGATEILLPSTLKTIGDYAFQNCYADGMKSVRFYDGLETIGNYAFYNCLNLLYVYIPSSVKSIGSVAFRTYVITQTNHVTLFFEAASFKNENTEVGDNFTNGDILYSKTVADFEDAVENGLPEEGADAGDTTTEGL